MTLRDLVPLIKHNDMLLMRGESELGLIRKEYIKNMLSEKYLNMKVDFIEIDESILDTIMVHVTEKDQVVFYADGKEIEEK